MRAVQLRVLCFVVLATLLGCLVVMREVVAQPAADLPPDAEGELSGDELRRAEEEGREADEQQQDQQPQTVQGQLARIKRQLAREDERVPRAPIRDEDHRFRIRTKNYIEIRNQNIVMQRRDYSCGAASLATICRYYWGDDVTEDEVLDALDAILTPEEIEDRIENGLAMSDLRRAAVKLGYQAVVGKTTFEKLSESKVPVIVGIEPGGHKHFVVYRGTDFYWVYMADPIRGNVRMPVSEFVPQWQENAILVVHKPGEKVKKYSPLSLREEDIKRGELNWYLIRTQQSRMPNNRRTLPP